MFDVTKGLLSPGGKPERDKGPQAPLLTKLTASSVLLRLAPRGGGGAGSRDGSPLTYFPRLDPAGKQAPPLSQEIEHRGAVVNAETAFHREGQPPGALALAEAFGVTLGRSQTDSFYCVSVNGMRRLASHTLSGACSTIESHSQ